MKEMGIKYMFIKLFLVVALVEQVLAGLDMDEGQKLYEGLFKIQDAKYTSFTPKDVMKKLERLVAIFKSNSYDASKPAYKPENQKTITDVYNVITELNCDRGALVKFNELMRSLSVYGNLVSTLEQQRNERFMKCKHEYAQSLKDYIDTVDVDKKAAITLLRGSILDYSRLGFEEEIPFYTPEAFDKGILDYLAKTPSAYQEKWKKDKVISESELATLYNEKVVSMCASFDEDFFKETEYFLTNVAIYSNLARMNDASARFWMINSYICQDATKRKQQVIEGLYKLMAAHANPKRRSLLKWIRDENVIARDSRYARA